MSQGGAQTGQREPPREVNKYVFFQRKVPAAQRDSSENAATRTEHRKYAVRNLDQNGFFEKSDSL